MGVTYLLAVSLLLQLAAVALALRLIRVTGRGAAWLLIAGALVLMAARRAITLTHVLGGRPPAADPAAEWVALAISVLLVVGLALVHPLFLRVRHSEERYRTLFEGAPIGLGVADLEGNLLAFNDAMMKPGGYTREEILAIGNVARLYADAEERARALEIARRDGGLERHPVRFKRKDGSAYAALMSLTPITLGARAGWLAMVEDVSEQKEAEEAYAALQRQLQLSQRLEAVGRLAGGIAHDFNNLLTAILSHAQMVIADLPGDDPRRADLREIAAAAERAAALTRQLLAFSRKQALQPRVIDLNLVVAEAERLLRRLIGEDVELVTRLERGLGAVRADPTQLEQVIMNLAVNARDAMPNGGRLIIETANVDLDQDYVSRHDVVRPGSYAMLSVTDTGTGMTEEVQAHVFEPFFTTKPPGTGTGLGLATVYGIVKQSDGYVWVYTEPGRGTTFKIYLPRVQAPVEPVRRREPPAHAPTGAETILVVEDDPSVRAVTVRGLTRSGYRVLEAEGGEQAIRIVESHPDPIHLLLTDTVMPGLGGPEVACEVRARRPGIKVLYMSGYAGGVIAGRGLDPDVVLLPKPFTTAALARAVRDALDADSAG